MYKFKAPDINAPRFSFKRLNIVNKDLHKQFIEEYPKYNDLSLQEFKNIIVKSNEKIFENVINYRDGVALPERLGIIFLGTCAIPHKFNANYEMSKEVNAMVKHQNYESDNHLAKIFYTNSENRFNLKHKVIWRFVASRKFKRTVAHTYPEKWKIYLQVERNKHISKLFQKARNKRFAEKMDKLVPLSYNEFSMD